MSVPLARSASDLLRAFNALENLDPIPRSNHGATSRGWRELRRELFARGATRTLSVGRVFLRRGAHRKRLMGLDRSLIETEW